MPVRIEQWWLRQHVEASQLIVGELPRGCLEVVRELLVGASANQHRADTGPLCQPVQCDLGDRGLMGIGNLADDVDGVEGALQVEVAGVALLTTPCAWIWRLIALEL